MTKHNIGRKTIAALIDYSIIITINFYVILTLGEPISGESGSYQMSGFPVLVNIIPWFILTVCFEFSLGSTLGNGIVDLKPVAKENQDKKITFIQSFQRHLLDPIDMLFFGLVGYLVMKSNENGQRLGDIWAKTVVVKYRN
jgi:uncharacterized RDD family membrane protein YckC